MSRSVEDTLERVRWRLATIDAGAATFGALAIGACAYLLYLGRNAAFFRDEWTFIFERSLLNPEDWLRPHNGHLVTFLVMVWRSLFEIVGLQSYLPFLAALLLVHAIAAAGVVTLVRRFAGIELALPAGLVVLLLGNAYENLFWSFQIGFVGSVAAGTWAMAALAAERPRPLLGMGLLVVSIGSSGIGLSFLAAAIVLVAAGPVPRRGAIAVAVPVALYLAWYLGYGAATTDPGGFAIENLLKMPDWVHTGASRAVGGLTGLGDEIGGVLFVVVAAVVVVRLLREPPGADPDRALATGVAAAAVTGIVVQFLLVGLARGHLDAGSEGALAPRYMYAPAALFLIALAALIRRVPGVDQRATRLRIRRGVVVAPFALLAILANVHMLHVSGVPYFEYQAQLLRTSLQVADEFADAPAVRDGTLPVPASREVMRDLRRKHATSTRDVLFPRNPPDPATYDRILFSIVGDSFRTRPLGRMPGATEPAAVAGTHVLSATARARCTELDGHGAIDSQVWFGAPSGVRHVLEVDTSTEIHLYLSTAAEPQAANAIRVDVAAHEPIAIEVPDMGADHTWTVRIKFPVGLERASLCRVSGSRDASAGALAWDLRVTGASVIPHVAQRPVEGDPRVPAGQGAEAGAVADDQGEVVGT